MSGRDWVTNLWSDPTQIIDLVWPNLVPLRWWIAVFCCRHSTRDSGTVPGSLRHASGFEAEEHRRSQPSQDVVRSFQSSDLGRESRLHLQQPAMPSQQIFNFMKDRMNDQKALDNRATNSPASQWDSRSASDHRDVDIRIEQSLSHGQDVSKHLTQDVQSKSGYTDYAQDWSSSGVYPFQRTHQLQTNQNEGQSSSPYSSNVPGIDAAFGGGDSDHRFSIYDHLSHSQVHDPRQTPAAEAVFSLPDTVQWMDSWTDPSSDSDLRNYGRPY